MERLALESTQARLDSALETNRRLELEQGREQLEGKHGDLRQHRHFYHNWTIGLPEVSRERISWIWRGRGGMTWRRAPRAGR